LGNYLGPLVVTVVVAIVYVVVEAWSRARPEVRENLRLLLIICVVPFAAMAILGWFDPSGWYLERYTAHFAPMFYLLLGAAFGIILTRRKHRGRFAILYVLTVATLIVGVVNLAQSGNYNFQRMRTNEAAKIAQSIGGCRTERSIVVDDIQTYVEISHYLPNCANLYFYYPETLTGAYRIWENSPARLEKQEIVAKNLVVVHEENATTYVPPSDYKPVAKSSQFQPVMIETFARESP
jgi:hypothetical protein